MYFTDFLDDCNVIYHEYGEHHHSTPGRVQFDCPWCSPDSGRFRMGYNLVTGRVSCWTCGKHPTISTLAELTRQHPSKIKEALGSITDSIKTHHKARGTYKPPKGVGPLMKQHRLYLESRGFDPDELAERYGVAGLGPNCGVFSWRIFIPITLDGVRVSWTTRTIADIAQNRARIALKRYRNASSDTETVSAKETLYSEAYALHAISIVEGCFDAMSIGYGAVATYGLNVTQEQIKRMIKYPIRFVCFDNEPVAQRAALGLVNTLSLFPGKTYNVVLSGKDANSSPKREIEELRRRLS